MCFYQELQRMTSVQSRIYIIYARISLFRKESMWQLQRKNVKDYLHLRIQELEVHEQDSKKASEIINNNDSDIEQKNTE